VRSFLGGSLPFLSCTPQVLILLCSISVATTIIAATYFLVVSFPLTILDLTYLALK